MDQPGSTRCADHVARVLREYGAEWAFGHPGGEVVTLIDALQRARIRFVLTRHEASAAFAAAGFAEMTGRIGVCVATLGPGATNLVTGVASALLERAPIVAISGALAESAPRGTTHQRLALHEMFSAVTKGSYYITGDAPAAMTRAAVGVALEERPGPVYLALAADVAAQPLAAEAEAVRPAAGTPQAVDAAALARARALLAGSKRPAIVVGLTAARQRAEVAVRRLSETLGAPVALTPKAKGVVPEAHPLFVGVLDMAGDGLVGEFLDGADLILAIGCDVVELDRRWTWSAPVLHVDAVPNRDGYYAAQVELVGPITELAAALVEGASAGTWEATDIARHRARLLDYARSGTAPLKPWQVIEQVQSHAGPAAVATCDVGAHKMLVGQLWQTTEPRTFFMANGLSSMGYSIPTAMAASLVHRGRRIIAFVGDGGLGMYLGELETLVRVGAEITIIVFADQRLELIRRAASRRGIDSVDVAFANPDFGAIGRAFGIPAVEVETPRDLDGALARADSGPGVHLIAARIDGSDYRL